MASYKPMKSGKVRAFVERNGVRDSQVCSNMTTAKAWATKREAELLDLKAGKFPKRTLREALVRYRDDVSPTKPGERWEVLRINAMIEGGHFGQDMDRQLVEIDSPHVAAWRDRRLSAVSVGTVLREANLLRAVFTRARKEWKWFDNRPFEDLYMPEPPAPRKRMVPWVEARRICRALGYVPGRAPETKSQETAVIFMVALLSSMRSGEIVSLEGERVHLERRVVRLGEGFGGRRTKNGEDREVAITKACAKLLKRVWKPDGPLFSVSDATRDALFRKAKKKAEVTGLHFHDSRRQAATVLSRKLGPQALAKITGHKDLKILQSTYYGESADKIAEMI